MASEVPDFDLEALYAALDEKREALSMTWSDVARAVSTRGAELPKGRVSASTITGIREKRSVEADGVLQMLRWLDRTPESFCAGCAREEALSGELAIPPDKALRFDAKAIYAAVAAKRTATGASWKDVAREIGGYSADGLTRFAKGGRVAFPGVMRVIRWTGQPATRFMRASDR
jgi:hypothetical protein